MLGVLIILGYSEEISKVLKAAQIVVEYVIGVYRNGKNKMPRRIRYNIFYNQTTVEKNTVLFESTSGNRVSGNPLAIFKYMLNDIRFESYTFIWCVNRHEIIPDKFKCLPQVVFVIRYTDLYYLYLSNVNFLVNYNSVLTFFVIK